MSEENRDSSDGLISLLAGIGVGVVVGAVVALLLAPQSGAQTRAQIRESADDALGRLRESMDEMRVKVDEITANAREALVPKQSMAPADAAAAVAAAPVSVG